MIAKSTEIDFRHHRNGFNVSKGCKVYATQKWKEMEEKEIGKANTANITPAESKGEALLFPLYFLNGVAEFKTMVQSLDNTFKDLIGNTRILSH